MTFAAGSVAPPAHAGAGLDERISAASDYLAARFDERPRAALVLGSGLGDVAGLLDGDPAATIAYADIPNVPVGSVAGHAGRLLTGRVGELPVAVLAGRAHVYEGWSQQDVTLLARALFAIGVRTLVVTNAAGALNPDYEPGDLMLIADVVNLSGGNPLTGPNLDRFGPRFPAMLDAMDPGLRDRARATAARQGLALREGVYVMLAGPSYETRAEMRMLRALGADAVGMSTVPEVIVARHAGVRVVGFSLITNKATDDVPEAASHEEVVEVGRRAAHRLLPLLRNLVTGLAA